MKYRVSALISLILATVLVALVAAQTSNSGSSGATSGPQGANTTSQQREKTKKLHLPPNFSADDAYKQNCTRCHAEVPKLDPKRSNTIMRHMRVRANLTKDEAQAILDYLRE